LFGSSPLRGILALSAFTAVALGMVGPASAGLRDLWPFGKKTVEEPVPDPLPYSVNLVVEGGDRRLNKTLSRASMLVDREDSPPSGVTGLLARARQDVSRLTAVLYENALYAGEVFITVDGRPLATIGPFDSLGAPPVPIEVRIIPGQPFVFGAIDVEPIPPGVNLKKLGLEPGAPAGSRVVLNAEAALLEAWLNDGHPLAEALPRDTIADHRTNQLDVTFNFSPGPIADFGQVTVVGAEEVNPNLIVGRAGLNGGLYSVRDTRFAEDRVRDLGAFDSVRIAPADYLAPDGTIPMTIVVSERKKHVIGASVEYSNTEGFGGEVYWRHRNLFGGAERLSLSASISDIVLDSFEQDYRLAATFVKPGVFDPMTDFTWRAEGYRDTTEAYRVTAVETEVGLAHIFSNTLTGSVGLELARTETEDDQNVTTDHLLLTLNTELVWDTRDNRLDPSSGFRATVMAAPSYDFLQDQAFARFGGDVSVYRAVGSRDQLVLAGRAATQVLTVDDITDVAINERIFLGGAGTIRGYGYENIAPRDNNGNLIGGRSSILFSGEARYRLNESFGIVGFVDAGNVYETMYPQFSDLKVGIGAGVRYLTPVGPIRLDVAVPLQPDKDDPNWAFYVGLGQAF
jgi:translocation and assembly module TamA